MAHGQQENKNHVPWCAPAERPLTSQDEVLSFHEKEDEDLRFW